MRQPPLEKLEDRLLYNADVALWTAPLVAEVRNPDAMATPPTAAAPTVRGAWLVADERSVDWDLALARLQGETRDGTAAEVVLVSPGQDGGEVLAALRARASDDSLLRVLGWHDGTQTWLGGVPLAEAEAVAAATATAATGVSGTMAPTGASADDALPAPRHEIVFVDAGIADASTLIDDILAQRDDDTLIEIVTLRADADGLAQIGAVLSTQSAIDSVHILAHGGPGALRLGDRWVDAAALADAAEEIGAWRAALSADADLLIYGCDVAQGQAGRAFVDAFAELTGADVAASTDLTGAVAQAGDWELEYRFGAIDSSTVLTALGQTDWHGALSLSLQGVETRVNTSTTGTQTTTSYGAGNVAMDASGNYVVVWNDGNTGDVYFQRYDANGVAQGSNTRANSTTANLQSEAQVAMDSSGNFVIVWMSALQDGSGDGIYAQRYNASGVAQGGEFRVNTTTANNQGLPAVAMDGSGNFVVTWTDAAADGNGFGVYAQRYSAAGIAQGGEFRVNTTTANSQAYPVIAMNAGGSFVIAWEQTGDYDIYYQRYTAAGVALGAETRINSTTFGTQWNAAIAMDDAGNFVVAWEDAQGADGSSNGIYARRFDVGTSTLGSEFRVNTTTNDQQTMPAIAMNGAGDFLVAWNSANQDTNARGVYAQHYTAGGTASGSEMRVNTTIVGDQWMPSVALEGGRAVVVWSGNGTGDADGVFMQRATVPAATTYVVTNTNDSGAGSLRQAIQDANANSGFLDTITFNIAGTGVHTIHLLSALPTITDAVILDAGTDDSFAAQGSRPAIVLSGDSNNDGTGDIATGLSIAGAASGGSTVRGFIFQGFTAQGVSIAGSDGNTIAGNWFGLDAAGTGAGVANGNGISLWNANNNIVGGSTPADRNVISGSSVAGITIDTNNGTTSGNQIRGNYIGTDATGMVAVGNAVQGIWVNAAGNTIGGTADGQGNVISGTTSWVGVQLEAPASNTLIAGNRIGLNAAGTAALGNAGGGVYVSSANNTIGGITAGARNVISGNGAQNLMFTGVGATGNVVIGNYIGTNAAGTGDVNGAGKAGAQSGVVMDNGASNNRIGTNADGSNDAAERNIISGNNWFGIEFLGSGTSGNVAQGNYIGVDVTGLVALGNSEGGASFWNGASNNRLGGGATGAGNVISGNDKGVLLANGVTNNKVQGNLIGLGADGSTALGNSGAGVYFYNGGSSAPVSGNVIGTDADGSNDVGERNTISRNDRGITMTDVEVQSNTIAGNFIGTDASGTLNRGNTSDGVYILGAANGNAVGGIQAVQANTIAFNGGRGIRVEGASTTGNFWLRNAIHGNGLLGIDIIGGSENASGVTANDSGDADSGANDLQNFPVLTSAVYGSGETTIAGTLNSTANTSFRIEFFSNVLGSEDASGHGEGRTYLGFVSLTTNGSGNATINTTLTGVVVPAGDRVTATATPDMGGGNYGGTSEFAMNVIATAPPNTAPTFLGTAFGGGDGIVTTPIGTSADTAGGMAVQADGKIVVVGQSVVGGNYDFSVARYNADGSLDTSFSGDGLVTTAVGTAVDAATSVALQADGKIVVAGYSSVGGNYDFAVVRYNSDGTLDTSFSGDGKLTTAVGTGGDYAFGVAVQADGKIVVAGYGNTGTSDDIALVRYNSDGTLDTSFSGDGKLTTAIGTSNDNGRSVAVQADGKILVAGYSSTGGNNDFALVRYNSNGTLDTSFSGDGIAVTSFGTQDYAYGMAIQADGKILVVGEANVSGNVDVALARFNTDGTLDTTFSGDGKVNTAVGTGIDAGVSVAVQANGKIVVAGKSSNGTNDDIAVLRYNSDGTLDTGFSGDGKLTTAVGTGADSSVGVVALPDGAVLVAGSSEVGGINDFAVVRYNADGSLSTAPLNTLNGSPTFVENGSAVVLDADVQITDAELGATNFAGATLTLARHGGANAQDVYSATGTLGSIAAAGGNVVVGATTIGTYTNSGGTLVLTFNANATNALVNSAMRQIAYRNASEAPPTSAQINWVFSDGNNGAQGSGGALTATGSTTVTITSVNDAPAGADNSIAVTEDTPYTFTAANFGFTDADGHSLSRVYIDSLPASGTLLWNGSSFSAGNFISAFDIGAGNLTYAPAANVFGSAVATFTFRVQDNGGTGNGGADTDPTANTITIDISAVNDAAAGSVTINDTTPTQGQTLTASNTLADADGLGTISYRWQRNGVDIAGATASTYTTTQADVDAVLRVIASYTDGQGTAESVASVNTAAVANVNDAPVLDNAGTMSLSTITEDDTSNAGQTVASIIASAGGDRITDADSGAVEGIALTAANSGNGLWQYSLDGATTWNDVGSVSNTSALLLRATDLLRFVPDGQAATTGTLTFRAWDQTSGTAGTRVSTAVNGAATAFSTATETASIAVTAVNDAPEWGAPQPGLAIYAPPVGTTDSYSGTGVGTAVLADGSVLTVGTATTGGLTDATLTRFLPDGSVDTSFGSGGRVTSPFTAAHDHGSALAVQADGRILVAGDVYNGSNYDAVVTRYLADGTLDTGFGSGGSVTYNSGGNDFLSALAVQADGRIVAAGRAGSDSFLMRLNSDGSFDTTFDSDGRLTLNANPSGNDRATRIALQGDGKIVVVGVTGSGATTGYVVRINTDGTLDAGFGSSGTATTTFGTSGVADITAVLVQADGKIVVGGVESDWWHWGLTRFNANGTLDTTFSGDGHMVDALSGNWGGVAGIAQLVDGKLIVGGYMDFGRGQSDWAIARYNANGTRDASYGSGGVAIHLLGDGWNEARSMAVGPGGEIVMAGISAQTGGTTLGRFTTSGAFDTSLRSGTLNDSPTFTEGGSPVVLDADVMVYDAELSTSNFNGATLTLVRNGGANADDVFSATGTLGTLTQGGALTINGTTIGTVTTNASGTLLLTFNASATDDRVADALRRIAYANTSDAPPAGVQINWTFDDGNAGGQGSGGALTATGSTTVSITATNDAPVNGAPAGLQTTPLNTALTFSVANGHSLTVSDVDATTLQLTLSVTHGTLTLAGTSGLVFSTGDGTADATMTLTGSAAAINTALDGLVFAPTTGYQGSDTLTMTTSDLGATGSGGTLTDVETVAIQIGAAVFQQGVNGYTGTEDTYVAVLSPSTDHGAATTVVADDNSATDAALLRFSNLFGNAVGQIPAGSTITGATLSIYVTNRDLLDSVTLHRMLASWTEASTYNSLASGVSTNGVEAASASLLSIDAAVLGWHNLSSAALTATVQAWADGETNNGFAFISHSADGWAFASSEHATAAWRPYLTVSFTPPQAPVVNTSGGTASFTENGSAVAVDPGLTLSDDDSTQLMGATVSVVGYVAGQDVLAFTDQSGITGTWNATTGTLSLSGTASVAGYQAALRSITFANTSEAPVAGARSIEFTVTDAFLSSTTASRALSVTALDDAPVLDLQAGGGTLYEGLANYVFVDAAAVVSDVDSADFDGGVLTAWLSANGTADDRLSVRHEGSGAGMVAVSGNQIRIDGALVATFSGGVGDGDPLLVTFTAAADAGAVQKVARRVTMTNVSDDPSGLVRTVSMSLGDGDGATSAVDTRSINVIPVNDAPVVSAPGAPLAATEQVAMPLHGAGFSVSDADANGAVLQATLDVSEGLVSVVVGNAGVTIGSGNHTGTVTLLGTAAQLNALLGGTSTGTVHVTATSDTPSATVTVTLTVDDQGNTGTDPGLTGGAGSEEGSASQQIVVTAVNDAPVITSAATALAAENQTVVLTVTSTDADGGAPTYSITGGADALHFTIDGGTGALSFNIAPDREAPGDADGDGIYEVMVEVHDGQDGVTQLVQVTVGDVNEYAVTSPADNNAAANTVAENAANGALVGITAGASDADATTNGVSYSLTNDAGGRFAIDANTGVVTVADGTLLNREAAASHAITVRATSQDGSTADTVFTITVNDVNEFAVSNPSDGNAAANSIAENAANGTLVGITAQASDADATTNGVTFSLFDDAGGRFAIDANTGVVTVADGSLLNREAAASHAITVRAQSQDGSTADTVFTITLTDVNEFAVSSPADASVAADAVAENAANGTLVGITAGASDADATTNGVSYSLTDDAGGRFAIDANTGVVTVVDGSLLNREAAASHDITVRATSQDGSTADTVFTITVTDVNEFAVSSPSDASVAADAVAENAANGTLVGITAAASDADATTNSVSYSLTDDAGGRFAIDANTGVVTVVDGSLLNREAAASHDITVRATSQDGSTADTVFTITLTDVNEFAVSDPADSNAAANSVAENAANGTLVGITAQASDADATTNGVSYSLADSAGGRFAIDVNTGVVTVADGSLLNREAAASHAITVRATSQDGSTSETVFTITVTDVNEFAVSNPADSNATANSVAENAANGTLVGITAQASDADATTNGVTFSLIDDAGGRFAIDANTGVVTVADGSLLNREAAASHDITVRATSQDGSTADTIFTIALTDVNEFAVSNPSDGSAAANAVAENAANGALVGITAGASDADATTNGVSYSLADDAGGRFAIDANTGVVTVADGSLLNREVAASHAITVRATSQDGSTADTVFTIAVTDVNEFAVSSPSDANAAANSVAENASNGSLVGITAGASDADATTSGVSYSLTDDAGGRFAIDANAGVISVADGSLLNREAAASHAITVRATSQDGSTADTTFTIVVTDVNEFVVSNPADSNATVNGLAENASNGTLVGITAQASDADATTNGVTFSLFDNAGGRFAIDANTGVVSVADGSLLNREVAASHDITVRATSQDGSTADTVFTIALTDVNEFAVSNPSDGNAAANSISENTANGTLVGITAQGSDADATTNGVSYSLADDAGGRFAIDANTGVVTVADGSLLNREAAASHDITVRATSQDGSTADTVFTIVVTDVNEFAVSSPSDGNAAVNSVAENASNGTLVGITAGASDADATTSGVSYSLTDDAGGRFAIDANTGVVTVADGSLLNREAAASHDITVRATSQDGSTADTVFTIVVTDVNEFAASSPSDGDAAVNSVAENAASGTLVGITAQASDADATTNGVSYSLADSAGGRFAIDVNTGVVTVADGSLLNREAAASHDITVRATSQDGSTADTGFTISLTDVNEFVVTNPADGHAAANAVAENAVNGTLVGITAGASDADATSNGVSYTLVDDAGGRFSIDANSGVVTVADGSLLDRDVAASHDITVRATSQDGSTADTVFTIAVTDVNEYPVTAPVDVDGAVNGVAENAASGTLVGITASASDADATTNLVSYNLADDAGGRFAIDASTGVVTVADGSLLDREAAASHAITVRATSQDGSTADTVFTITLTDVNEFAVSSPADGHAAANAVAENAGNGTLVGITAQASDADATTNGVTYTLVDDAGGRFGIDANTGVVMVADGSLLNREAAASHAITVRATSQDGSTADTVFTITVTDANEFAVSNPADADAAANSVAENAANGTLVGITAQAGDADATTNGVSYSLADDAGGRFAIDANTGVVTVADGSLLNREAAASHAITVRATSQDGSTADTVFTIVLSDVNEYAVTSPADNNVAANAVAENAANGALVGVTASASDADATTNDVSYSLTDDAGGRFAIDANTGVVTVADGSLLNREAAASHAITVRATSQDGSTADTVFTIVVTDVNEFAVTNPADSNAAANSVAENAANGTLVGITAQASDADATTNGVTYTLVDDAGGRFGVDANTGVISVADGSLLNREAAASHAITVRATSQDGSTADTTFTIVVTDANEFAVSNPVDGNAAANSIAENASNGALVGITAGASDADATTNGVSYSLADDAGGRFAIDANTGVVTVVDGSLLNREAAASHAITVRATSQDGSTADTVFTIILTDVNEFAVSNPADGHAAANAVAENAANGTLVGITAAASDADATTSGVSYSLADDAGGRFAIDANTGVVTVADGSLLNREAAASHAITVRATSQDGSTADTVFTITVNDVNEFVVSSPADGNAAANAVAENASNGTLVGITAGASDADATTNGVSYSLADDAGGRFAIDANTGVVTVADGSLLNREAAASHAITVRATSQDGSTADTVFTIALTDTNEFAVTSPADGHAAANVVAEGATTGTVVGITAAAVDADATTNGVSYSLADDAGGRFTIDANTGVVTVADGTLLDREAAASHAITVRATSQDGSTADTVFTIAVTDINESAVTTPADADAATNRVVENATAGTTVGITARAHDADATTAGVSYQLVDDAGGRFAIDANTGVVTVADGGLLDREAAASHAITVRATSQDGSTADSVFTITVDDVNDLRPRWTSHDGAAAARVTVDENSTTVDRVEAVDPDTLVQAIHYSIAGGADADRFTIDAVTGALQFRQAPDHEAPRDRDGDNVYVVELMASDGQLSALQTLTITVANVNEAPSVVAGALDIAQGATVQLRSEWLEVTDVDTPAEQMVLSVESVSHGEFVWAEQGGKTALQFTWADIEAGRIAFRHDGSDTPATWSLRISDGANVVTIQAGAVVQREGSAANPVLAPTQPSAGPSLPAPAVTADDAVARPRDIADDRVPVVPAYGQDAPARLMTSGFLEPLGAVPDGDASRDPASAGHLAQRLVGESPSGRLRSLGEAPPSGFEAALQALIAAFDAGEGAATVPAPIDLTEGLSIDRRRVGADDDGAARRDPGAAVDSEEEGLARRMQFTAGDIARAGGLALSLGALFWVTRAGGLISSLLMSLPAWRQFDPLPILGAARDESRGRAFAQTQPQESVMQDYYDALADDILERAKVREETT